MRVSRVRAVVAMLLALVSVSIGAGLAGTGLAYAASPTGVNQQTVYDWYVSQGLAPTAAAGLVGNLDFESAGVNPDASQCGSNEVAPPKGWCGVGIAQWTWGQNQQSLRWQDLVGLADVRGEGVTIATTDPGNFPSLSVQMQYVWQELNTTYRSVLSQMQSCANETPVSTAIECSTYAVQNGYEVPQNHQDRNPDPGCASPPDFCTRYSDALAVYNAYGPPSAPSGLSARATSSSTVELSWQPSAKASGYEVFRNGAPVAGPRTTWWTDSGLTPGGSYTYSVMASDAIGHSTLSTASTATTAPAQTSLSASVRSLAFPGGAVTLVASAAGASSYNYSYSASSGAPGITGWLPGTKLAGKGASLALSIPPNKSDEPETYTFAASGTNGGGTSGTGAITVTVGGRRSVKAATARTPGVAAPATCVCVMPVSSPSVSRLGGGRASAGESAHAAPAAHGR